MPASRDRLGAEIDSSYTSKPCRLRNKSLSVVEAIEGVPPNGLLPIDQSIVCTVIPGSTQTAKLTPVTIEFCSSVNESVTATLPLIVALSLIHI